MVDFLQTQGWYIYFTGIFIMAAPAFMGLYTSHIYGRRKFGRIAARAILLSPVWFIVLPVLLVIGLVILFKYIIKTAFLKEEEDK